MKILCIGPQWRGSNAGGLFKALSRKFCIIEIVDEFYWLSLQSASKVNKLFNKILRPLQEKDYNAHIVSKINVFKPDILFVYKGSFITPQTLQYARKSGCILALFFPDVSMTNHGENIGKSLPLYDIIFTTKTFGIKDLNTYFGVTKSVFIPHGFDPEIHRKLEIDVVLQDNFGCDASFIGTYSPHKHKLLTYLKTTVPGLNLKIWGSQWDKNDPVLKSSIQGLPVTGDLYAIAIQCSKINLGLLSEVVKGSSSGDLITSRTYHIPGAGGFMLHERNEESILYFDEDKEASFFNGEVELVEKVRYFLANPAERMRIKENGYKKACAEHSLDNRAEVIMDYFKKMMHEKV